MAYAVTAGNQEYEVVPYGYEFHLDIDPNYQTRGYRQDRPLRGRKNKDLPDEALKDEVIVILGAGMSPKTSL